MPEISLMNAHYLKKIDTRKIGSSQLSHNVFNKTTPIDVQIRNASIFIYLFIVFLFGLCDTCIIQESTSCLSKIGTIKKLSSFNEYEFDCFFLKQGLEREFTAGPKNRHWEKPCVGQDTSMSRKKISARLKLTSQCQNDTQPRVHPGPRQVATPMRATNIQMFTAHSPQLWKPRHSIISTQKPKPEDVLTMISGFNLKRFEN